MLAAGRLQPPPAPEAPQDQVSAFFFDDLLANCCNEIITHGMETTLIPSTIKDWLAGKIFRSLPKRFIQKFVSFMLENRDFSDHIGCKVNPRGTEFTMCFYKSNSERAQKNRAVKEADRLQKDLFGTLHLQAEQAKQQQNRHHQSIAEDQDDSKLPLHIFNQQYETASFNLEAGELIHDDVAQKTKEAMLLSKNKQFYECRTCQNIEAPVEDERSAQKRRELLTLNNQLNNYINTSIDEGDQGKTIFTCKLCGKAYSDELHIKSHLRNGHKMHKPDPEDNKNKNNHQCDICHARFGRKDRLRRHYKSKHGKDLKLVEAEILIFGKVVDDGFEGEEIAASSADDEMVDENELDPGVNASKTRGRKPTRFSGLDPKVYNPETGLKWSSYKEKVKRYEEIVHDEAANCYLCVPCGKQFDRVKNIIRHVEQVHYKLNIFKCDQCPEAFRDAQKLRKHKDSVHRGISCYACEYCGKTFSRKEGVREHKQRLHMAEYEQERQARASLEGAQKRQRMMETMPIPVSSVDHGPSR